MLRVGTIVKVLIPAAVLVAVVAAFFAASSGSSYGAVAATRPLVRTAKSATLHKTVLVNRKGLTLYSLSAETRGRFICTTKFCLSLWTPLDVTKGTRPMGAAHLSTVKRPDGRIQVTYRGLPLYTFNEDRKPGDVKGNGFKDVGVWRPAFPTRTSSPPPPPGGGYGGYGGYGG